MDQERKSLEIVMLLSPVEVDKIMHDFDVFERSKRLIIAPLTVITTAVFGPEFDPVQYLSFIKNTVEEKGVFAVIVAYYLGNEKINIITPGVLSISTGEEWVPLKSYLDTNQVPNDL